MVFKKRRTALKIAKLPKVDGETGVREAASPVNSNAVSHDNDVAFKHTHDFHWQNISYDITIKGEPRTILDKVDGWVKPGTLTALMVRDVFQ